MLGTKRDKEMKSPMEISPMETKSPWRQNHHGDITMETLPWRHHHGDNTTRVECVLHINVMVLMVAAGSHCQSNRIPPHVFESPSGARRLVNSYITQMGSWIPFISLYVLLVTAISLKCKLASFPGHHQNFHPLQ